MFQNQFRWSPVHAQCNDSASFATRLEKLALEAGSTPEQMLDFGMQDGFDFTENFVQQVKQGLADVEAGRIVSHEEAMVFLRSAIEQYGNKAA